MENYATRCAEWIEKWARAAEQADPHLRPLKDRINQFTERIASASGAKQGALLRQQNQAIRDLINHVASKSGA